MSTVKKEVGGRGGDLLTYQETGTSDDIYTVNDCYRPTQCRLVCVNIACVRGYRSWSYVGEHGQELFVTAHCDAVVVFVLV